MKYYIPLARSGTRKNAIEFNFVQFEYYFFSTQKHPETGARASNRPNGRGNRI